MLFQVHTVYDPETLRELRGAINGSVPGTRRQAARRNLLLAGAACLAGSAVLAFGFQNTLMAILLLMWGIILLTMGVGLQSFLAARQEKEAKKKQEVSESDAAFAEEGFTVRNQRGENGYAYADCQALLETSRHFILMVGERHAVALDKDGFQAGAPEEFRTFIQEKTGKTFG